MKENDLVFGIRAVIEAIQADKEIDKILIRRDLQSNLSRELFEVLKGRSIPVQPSRRDCLYGSRHLPTLGRPHPFHL